MFYYLSSTVSSRTNTQARSTSLSVREEAAILLDGAQPPSNWVLEHQWGLRNPRDVISVRGLGFLFRDPVLAAFREAKLTGWDSCRVQYQDGTGRMHEDYSALRVLGRVGPWNPLLSRPGCKQYPAQTVPGVYGRFFAPETWDGSDFCVETGTHVTIISQRARDVIAAKVRHLDMTPLDEMFEDEDELIRAGFEIRGERVVRRS